MTGQIKGVRLRKYFFEAIHYTQYKADVTVWLGVESVLNM
jgi:hypothetical protein